MRVRRNPRGDSISLDPSDGGVRMYRMRFRMPFEAIG
jgi:hypothetical protein